ncbi:MULTISPECIES: gluconeogenesis factor YvcK family protein [Peptoniphilus]|uniref:gluconeogenesis factor YvcK family protein n=1 Tax=Peptoniphilus TaxID=162289 RepID=UPI0001DA9A13|nr:MULTISPECIES: gluconeogenesis factor YvcK family protein [Peptoniphilus]EFI41837.1 hypothetical protein HMPREF0629_00465 [Peptoniphilus sp. oral taxon 386 str. F0131]
MKNVVVVGGGTGISALLRGIKKYTENLTAIVTMADDGGGSGRLRSELGILPPGDVRNCLSALANTEPVMEKLLQFRFDSGTLKGQNFGNILIAALCEIYGSFDTALMQIENVLSITGKVIPVTLENIHLVAEFYNGDKCIGESMIPSMSYKLDTGIKNMSMFPKIPQANPKATDAILDADVIIFGPGSLYTSIIPNLLVEDIVDSIKKSDAQKIYVSNIMTQKGETLGYTLADHIKAFEKYSYENILDACVVNNMQISEKLLKYYLIRDRAKEIKMLEEDKKFLNSKNIDIILGDFVEENSKYIRHSGIKIAEALKNSSIL